MKKYTPPPHREFPRLLPATEENIERLLASARKRKQERLEQKIAARMLMFLVAMLILSILILFFA